MDWETDLVRSRGWGSSLRWQGLFGNSDCKIKYFLYKHLKSYQGRDSRVDDCLSTLDVFLDYWTLPTSDETEKRRLV